MNRLFSATAAVQTLRRETTWSRCSKGINCAGFFKVTFSKVKLGTLYLSAGRKDGTEKILAGG